MTTEQKKKFDNIILEYDEYINNACDEKTKQYYCECRKKILELKKALQVTNVTKGMIYIYD